MSAGKHRASQRLKREKKTLKAMFVLFCGDSGHHPAQAGEKLCPECAMLLKYAGSRIDMCPYKEDKPTCVRCPVHCYEAEKRKAVKKVMRHAGPKMPLRHPYLSIMHALDGIFAGKGAVKKCSK